MIVNAIKHVKLMNIAVLEIALVKKHLTGKLVLEWEDEILNITEILLNDKKVACAKSNCIFHW